MSDETSCAREGRPREARNDNANAYHDSRRLMIIGLRATMTRDEMLIGGPTKKQCTMPTIPRLLLMPREYLRAAVR